MKQLYMQIDVNCDLLNCKLFDLAQLFLILTLILHNDHVHRVLISIFYENSLSIY